MPISSQCRSCPTVSISLIRAVPSSVVSPISPGAAMQRDFFQAKKGPFKLEDSRKFRYQLQDEHQAFNQAQDAASKQLERRNLIPKTCRRLPSTWDGLSPRRP